MIYNAVAENINVAANQYKALFYRNIYAGIDLRFTVQANRGIKYEFIVHSGADVNAIKIKWIGADKVSADANGGLRYFNKNVHITDSKPVSFCEGKPIESKFITNEDITTFNVAEYNRNQDLIIDPVLQWSTYYGSYGPEEIVTKILSDKVGNAYVMVLNTNEYDSRLITPSFDSIKWISGVYAVLANLTVVVIEFGLLLSQIAEIWLWMIVVIFICLLLMIITISRL